MTQPDWDDERLDAAFHARFDHPAPTGLANDVHVRIAGTSPARFGGFRVNRAWSLAAAAVVVVLVVGSAFIGLGGLGRVGSSPPPDASGGPVPSATPTQQAVPGVVLEQLPVIDVSDAIAIRDAGVDDREIAVHGWFTPATIDCQAASDAVNPILVDCPDELAWLTEDPESLVRATPTSVDRFPPEGAAIEPVLAGLSDYWYPDLPLPGSGTGSVPADVVLVGHFDDRRAAMCPTGKVDACRDRFVVDNVAMVDGKPQRPSFPRLTDPVVSTEQDIETIIQNEAPGSEILSATVVGGATGLGVLEPSLGTGQANLIDQKALWVVRVLESDKAVTYIVIDGSDAIYEMNAAGEPILVGGTPPPASASGSPALWSPAGARVVTLTSEVGAGQPPVRVAVVDESGRLAAVSETGAVDPSTMSFEGRFGAYSEPGIQGRVHLSWVGGICDSQVTVTVSREIDDISFDMGPQSDCDSIGIGRQLVLDFAGSVDIAAIRLHEGPATPSATASATADGAYELDCGPLGPDTCAEKATAVIAATPSKRVVSLVFTDECGSYTVDFDGGDGIAASIDCIPAASPG